MPRRASERTKPFRSSRVLVSTSGPAGSIFEATTSVSTAAARNAASISSSICSRKRPSMSARSSASVSNSLAARASSSSISGSTFWLIDLSVTSTVAEVSSPSSYATCFVSPTLAPTSAVSTSSTSRPAAELDDGVGLRLSGRADEIDDDGVTRLRGPVGDRHELGDRFAQRVELARDQLLGHLVLGARHLELRPVDDLGQRLHLDGRLERPGLVVGGRQLEVVLGPGHGPQARARDGARVPAADVAVDGLGVEALLADPGQQHRPRHLPFPKTGDLDRLREIRRRVLHRVLEVVRRHVHRQADAVPVELLDLCSHAGHSIRPLPAARGPIPWPDAGERNRTSKGLTSHRDRQDDEVEQRQQQFPGGVAGNAPRRADDSFDCSIYILLRIRGWHSSALRRVPQTFCFSMAVPVPIDPIPQQGVRFLFP